MNAARVADTGIQEEWQIHRYRKSGTYMNTARVSGRYMDTVRMAYK